MKTVALALTIALTACTSSKSDAPAEQSPALRGKYLVDIGGCNDCHTPMKMTPDGPAPDSDRLLSGHPAQFALPPAPSPAGPWMVAIAATGTSYAGPWGTTFTSNLTPDKATGIGRWTADNFVATIRNGKHMGTGRALLPPMPWQNYAQMTDDDLRAVFAYLASLPAISNKVPDPIAPPTAMLDGHR